TARPTAAHLVTVLAMNDIPVRAILVLVLFLFGAGVFAIVFKRLRFPYTIGLVLVGLGLGGAAYRIEAIAFLSQIHFTPNIVLYILLPTLVFEAALNINTRLLIRNLLPVILLAAPGLVFATLVTGAIVAWLTPLSFGAAMLFGALISATDPVAVIAVFRELGAPKRLTMLVDGESLFNDATAMVMFSIVLGLLTGGTVLGFAAIAWASVQFVLVFLGGTLVGALVGYLMVQVLSLSKDDPLVEIAFTAVIAYIAFILAQFYLDLSGVMAVVGAGLVVGYYGSTRFSPAVKEHLSHFWEFACFAANSFIFLLLGLTENYLSHGMDRLYRVGLVVLAAVFAITVARALLIFGFVPCINKVNRRAPIGFAYQAIMFWGGLRGALPIALAMSLTSEQVGGDLNRSLIIDCTLGVVLFTLLVQGTTISWLMNWLGLGELSPVEKTLMANTRLALKREGLAAVEAIGRKWPALDLRPIELVAAEYRTAIDGLTHAPADEHGDVHPERVRAGVLWMLTMHESNAVWRELYDAGFLRENLLREYEQYFELCREDILRGVMPPRAPRRSGIGDRTVGLLLKWTERIRMTRRWTHRLRHDRTESLHAIGLAAASSFHRLESNMAHLRELCDASDVAVEQCMGWARDWCTEALTEIGRIVAKHPAAVAQLDTDLVRRLARETERRNLEELVKKGGISEQLAAMLA
ncbi:MAG: sodium:proton antiporter, partial [Patescibacteria group bacterium]|nr:sodium:proton antiporter [Patescibacteria group bacterium]